MQLFLILFVAFIFLCNLALVVLNYYRIEKIINQQHNLLSNAKRDLDQINNLLMSKYENKKKIDVEVLNLMNNKINGFERTLDSNSLKFSNDIDQLKKNIEFLLEEHTIISDLYKNTPSNNVRKTPVQEPNQEPVQEPNQEPVQEPNQEPNQEPVQEPVQDPDDVRIIIPELSNLANEARLLNSQ